MINVGIFWVIRGRLYCKKQEKDVSEAVKSSRAMITGMVDCDFGHFEEWDALCGRLYPRADFATFPRGRVIYDIQKKDYAVYADECITEEELRNVADVFGLRTYRVCRDEHYSCDKCVKRKGLFD